MKKILILMSVLMLSNTLLAGKIKINQVGKPDVYAPTLENDGKTLTVENVSGPGSVPIGGMVAIMPTIDAANAWQPPATGVIKDGFMRADGTRITQAHRNQGCKLAVDVYLPSMVAKYPRGNASTSGATGGNSNGHYHTNGSGSTAATSVEFAGGTASGDFASTSHGHTEGSLVAAIGASQGEPNTLGYIPRGAHPAALYVYSYTVIGSGVTTAERYFSHATAIFGTTAGPNSNASVSNQAAYITDSNTVTGNYGTTAYSLNGNDAGSNEPAYIETVWVIKVK